MADANAGMGLSQGEGSLTQAADRVSEARGDLMVLADQLSGQLDALRGQWAGAGAAAFAQVHQAWQDKQRRIVGALDGLSSSLIDTDRVTTAADAAQSDVMTRTAARLSGL